jgi:hypothetical protein
MLANWRLTQTKTVLLLVLGLGVLAACDQIQPSPQTTSTPTRTPTPSLLVPTDVPTITPTAFVFPPTVTRPPSACVQAPRPTRLVLRERGVVVDDLEEETRDELVNVRSAPGTQNRVVGQLEIGDVFLVLDGPECSASYAWFQIQMGDLRGWIAEGDIDAYYVAPFLPE